MKKKWIRNLIVVGVCVAMLGSTFGMDYLLVKADSTENESIVVKEIETEFEITNENSGFPIKEETVFITTDATGKTTDIQVSDWLKNPEGYEVIKDASNLSDIENVNGEELFMRKEEVLNIQANGADIYYRGVLDSTVEIPIALTVSYELDGVEIQATELEGKTGHLKMSIQYKNKTNTTIEEDGELYEVCVPFAVTSIMMIPSEKISNVTIENGKVVETGSYAMVLGFGFPGINESFGVEEGVFTDTVILEADVTEYSLQTIMTYCSNNSFRDADLDNAKSVDAITKSLETITNHSVEGLEEINSFDELLEELDEKKADLNQMNIGAGELKDGAKDLNSGANELKNSMKTFDSSMIEASTGATKLATGASTAVSSSNKLAAGANQVSSGMSTLKSGLNTMYSGIEAGIAACDVGLNMSSSISAYEGLCLLEANAGLTVEQAAQKAQLEGAFAYVLNATSAEDFAVKLASVKVSGFTESELGKIEGKKDAFLIIKGQMDSAKLTQNVATLATGAGQVSSGVSQLNSGLSTLSGSTEQLANAMTQLSEASSKLEKGTIDLADGSSKLVDGTAKMKEGTQELASLFEGDASMFVNTGKALQKAAEKYNTFSALRLEEKGMVSFVIKTE